MEEINQDLSIKELLDSINDSMNDIRSHPVETKELPSNFEIMVRGISDSHAIDFLFSSGLDKIIERLFDDVSTGNFDAFEKHKKTIEDVTENIFGPGSFKGPVSQTVLNSVQATMMSQKYNNMRSILGKNVAQMKKIRLIIKNLEKAENTLSNKEEIKKYRNAVYAIKKCLIFVAKIYRNRKIINRKVYNGIKNIIHENEDFYDIDEAIDW